MSMNKKISFFLGFVTAAFLFSVVLYLFSKEVSKQNEAVFMSGYALEVSSLEFVLNESDESKRSEIAKSELCEAISVLKDRIENGNFNQYYFEVVISESIIEYRVKLTKLSNKHCAKNI